MYLRIHEGRDGPLIAACDRELIGRVFQQGSKRIDLERYQEFYKGTEATGMQVEAALKQRFASANLVGKKATAAAIRAGLARAGDMLRIARVPYIHIYRI